MKFRWKGQPANVLVHKNGGHALMKTGQVVEVSEEIGQDLIKNKAHWEAVDEAKEKEKTPPVPLSPIAG